MAHPFEFKDDVTVDASPAEVWEAITNAAQVDSWFMGRSEITPGQGGVIRTDVGDFVLEWSITAWEPGRRLAYQSAESPDGSLMAFEYLIEGRGGGETVIRFVHSGFLGSDDWEAEYDALMKGDPAYLHKLAQYLTYFRGRIAAKNLFVPFQQPLDKARVWAAFHRGLGLNGPVALNDPVSAALDGLPRIDGVIDFQNDDFLGVRADDGLYRFIHGHDGSVVVERHIFSENTAHRESLGAWQAWLGKVLAS